jgi:hypothetical protein
MANFMLNSYFSTNLGHIYMNNVSYVAICLVYSDIQNLLVSASAIRHCASVRVIAKFHSKCSASAERNDLTQGVSE